jgi:16S rRNA (adenine1518-N6/adenine1519-N6)-dimethyltransferase
MAARSRRPRLGQHFLHDPAVAARIVDAIAPEDGTPIVEIGPGQGALTRPLLERAGVLHVVEIDARLAEALAQRCGAHGALHVHRADALRFDFAGLGPGPVKVAGNLPYNISTPLLFHLLGQADRIREMVFMLQKEVVERMCAPPGTPEFGRLSVSMQARCDVQHLFNVGPGAFRPPPRVDSAVVRLIPRPDFEERVRNPEAFAVLVRRAFQQRRKMVRNALLRVLPGGIADLERVGIAPSARAGDISVDQYIALANLQGSG